MKVTQFDRATAKLVDDEVKAALEQVAAKYGLDLQPGTGRFDAGEFKPGWKFVPATPSASLQADAKRQDQWQAKLNDLPADVVGREFLFQGNTYVVTGFNPASAKYPVKASRQPDGKKMKFGASLVRGLLNKSEAA